MITWIFSSANNVHEFIVLDEAIQHLSFFFSQYAIGMVAFTIYSLL